MNRIYIPAVVIISSFFFHFSCNINPHPPIRVTNGVMDLRNQNLDSISALCNGEWEFYWKKLRNEIKPDDPRGIISVPGKWNNFIFNGKPVKSFGYGLYRLKILLPEKPHNLALKFINADGGMRVYVNGKAYDLGIPGKTKEETVQKRWQYVIIPLPQSRIIEVEVEISNFLFHLAGLKNEVEIGDKTTLEQNTLRSRTIQGMIAASVLLLGFYHLVFYFFYRNKIILYFSIFLFLAALRSFLFKDGILYIFFPDIPVEVDAALLHSSVYLLMVIVPVKLHSIFPREFNKKFRNLFVFIGIAFFSTLILPLPVYSYIGMAIYPVIFVIIFVLLFSSMLAVKRKRSFAIIYFLSYIIGGLGILVDIFLYYVYGILSPYTPLRQLGLILFQNIFIAGKIATQEKEKIIAIENEKRYKWISFTDELTGLFNKRYFQIQSEHIESLSAESRSPYSLLMMDIDNFKKINDIYGHLEGDRILKEVGNITLEKYRIGPVNAISTD